MSHETLICRALGTIILHMATSSIRFAILGLSLLATTAHATGEKLYAVHWWDYANPTVGAGPDGGWSVETVIPNSAAWWQAPWFTPLYQQVSTTHNAAIVTRIDYDWGQTVPAPTTLGAQNWATRVVNEVVNPLGSYAKRWIIGNEPNIVGEGGGWTSNQVTPAGYAQIYTAVRSAIKAVRLQDEVLFAPVSPGGVIAGVRWKDGNQWLAEAIDATLALPSGAIDGFALHAYGGQATAAASVTEFHNGFTSQLAVIDARPLRNTPVYITEWNRATATTGNLAANEQVTADFITQSLADVDSWNRTPGNHNIRSLAWFIDNKDYGDAWNQYSLEWWQSQGNPTGSSGDLYTALMNSSGFVAGMVGTRPIADYNADAICDAADVAVWRAAFGKTNFPYADGNRNGKVDAADYVLWRNSTTNTATAAFTALPEPTSFALLSIACTCAIPFQRRRTHSRSTRAQLSNNPPQSLRVVYDR